jgi:hypothetical protein
MSLAGSVTVFLAEMAFITKTSLWAMAFIGS